MFEFQNEYDSKYTLGSFRKFLIACLWIFYLGIGHISILSWYLITPLNFLAD